MTEVLFYHLTESRLDEVLPGLLEKTVERGWRAVVQCGTEEFRDALDEKLWTFSEASFVAHATDEHENADAQPVILTTQNSNPNSADVRFIVDGAVPPDLTPYRRAVLVFDGHDEGQKADARESWTKFKAGGHDVTYWQQNADRKWEKKG
jgi:DNA polymerase III subunit chi